MKHVDEYHLTGISQDMFVQWERRPPTSTDGRGENRSEARGDGKAKPEQIKLNDAQCSEGLVSLTVNLNSLTTQVLIWPIFVLKSRLTFDLSKSVSLGQLWLELLRFYTLEFALEEYIISIRFRGLLSREMKNWPRRRLAIEGEPAV